ncbi:DUF3298 domain-containing protein [Pseudoflavonifractor sp. 524-17]|uniref:DUF3298 and DUF4163 domain-containing protein n=1 Tax=Pseudoflavonifractor sp. 524-17 TaxID=2304577 RepID=UPI0013796DB9|nr:DUF3298 and DUF4163 domain-containing protein [Pseudoflavonifractor sp. 524-17]NCE63413.1 DUF3298 domain-containing protein [Pseudoflavonifractor sp. 524-17]
MKKFAAILIAAGLTLGLGACGGPEPSAAPETTPAPAPSPTPAPELPDPALSSQTFSKTFTAEDGTTVLIVNYTLPDFTDGEHVPALKEISSWYAQEGQALLEEAEGAFQAALGDYEVSQAAGLEFGAVFEEMTFEVSLETPQVISFSRTFYANRVGAAHPNVFRLGEQFDLTTGERLTFTQCVTDPSAAAGEARAAVLQSEAMQALFAGGVDRHTAEGLFQPENFVLTPEGFRFWFQSGELGPGAPVEIDIPYSALEEYLVPWIAD